MAALPLAALYCRELELWVVSPCPKATLKPRVSELRNLPKVDTLLGVEELKLFPHSVRVAAARAAVGQMRAAMTSGEGLNRFNVVAVAVAAAEALSEYTLRPVVNLSGVVLHTGLGRARLASSVAQRVQLVASSHSALELDLESGTRGDRQGHVRSLLCELTGAEDSLVVNNAAAGVVLTLAALAQGREVILSRGQMVEIGGSFRMPDIVRESGCRLVEVGCTNKTRLSDYSEAISEETAAILRCHPSNFRVVGFTSEPSLSDLATLARERGTVCIDDIGSGCLVDTTRFGLPKEPTIQMSLGSGAHVTICSGDKLLGGPQAGLILGCAPLLEIIRKHPLARAFRIDKLSLSALQATLQLYREGRELEIPTLRYLAREAREVKTKAARLAKAYSGTSKVLACKTEVGGGSAPGAGVDGFAAVLITEHPGKLCQTLRQSNPSILARVQDNAVWLDPRTAEDDEITAVSKVLRGL